MTCRRGYICHRREKGSFQFLCKCGKGSGDARWTQVRLFLHLFTFKKVIRRDITCGILSLLSFCMSAICELWTRWQQIDPGCCSLDWYLCRQWSFRAFLFSPLCCASWSERELWVGGGPIWGKMSHQESQRGVKPCMGKRGSVASFCPLCALGKMI